MLKWKKKPSRFCFCNRFLNLKWSITASHRLSLNNRLYNQSSSQSVSTPLFPFSASPFFGPVLLSPPLILNSPTTHPSLFLFHFICFWMQPFFCKSSFFFTRHPLLQPFLLHPSVLRSLTQLSHSWSIPVGLAFSILRLQRPAPPLPPPPTVTVAGMNRQQIKGVCVWVCERLLSSHFLSSPSSLPAAPLPLWSASITFNRLQCPPTIPPPHTNILQLHVEKQTDTKLKRIGLIIHFSCKHVKKNTLF